VPSTIYNNTYISGDISWDFKSSDESDECLFVVSWNGFIFYVC